MEIFENTLGLQFFIPLLSAMVVKGLLNVTFAASGLNLLILPCSLIWTRSSFPGYTASCVPSKWAFKQINLRHFIKSTLMQKPPPELNNYFTECSWVMREVFIKFRMHYVQPLVKVCFKDRKKNGKLLHGVQQLKKILSWGLNIFVCGVGFCWRGLGGIKIFFFKADWCTKLIWFEIQPLDLWCARWVDVAGFCLPCPAGCTQCIQADGWVPFGLWAVLWLQPMVQGKQFRSGYKSI